MTVASLKKTLNALPPECDDYQVEIMTKVIPLSGGCWAREDSPVFGSILDDANREFVLAGKEQLEQFTAYAQQNSNSGCDPEQHLSTLNSKLGEQNRE